MGDHDEHGNGGKAGERVTATVLREAAHVAPAWEMRRSWLIHARTREKGVTIGVGLSLSLSLVASDEVTFWTFLEVRQCRFCRLFCVSLTRQVAFSPKTTHLVAFAGVEVAWRCHLADWGWRRTHHIWERRFPTGSLKSVIDDGMHVQSWKVCSTESDVTTRIHLAIRPNILVVITRLLKASTQEQMSKEKTGGVNIFAFKNLHDSDSHERICAVRVQEGECCEVMCCVSDQC